MTTYFTVEAMVRGYHIYKAIIDTEGTTEDVGPFGSGKLALLK